MNQKNMPITYYWAAYQGSGGVGRPVRIPGDDGPQHHSVAAAVKAYQDDTSPAHSWTLRAMRDGVDDELTHSEEEEFDRIHDRA